MKTFGAEIQTHMSLLNQTSNPVKDKFMEIHMDVKKHKHIILDATRTLFKAITENWDASDSEYSINRINELNKGHLQVRNL